MELRAPSGEGSICVTLGRGWGAPLEEPRAQPMEDAKNIKTAMFTDYPKGKQITAIMQAVGILISAYLLLLHPDTTLVEARAQTKQHIHVF